MWRATSRELLRRRRSRRRRKVKGVGEGHEKGPNALGGEGNMKAKDKENVTEVSEVGAAHRIHQAIVWSTPGDKKGNIEF